MISPHSKMKALNHVYSVDGKRMPHALHNLNVHHICYCLALAIMKHIRFSRGFLFLEDLMSRAEDPTARFSYSLRDPLKLQSAAERPPGSPSAAEEEVDLNYSCSQLEQFLKDEQLTERGVKSTMIISSFMRSLNRFNSNSNGGIPNHHRTAEPKMPVIASDENSTNKEELQPSSRTEEDPSVRLDESGAFYSNGEDEGPGEESSEALRDAVCSPPAPAALAPKLPQKNYAKD